jgi:Fic family protein
MLVDTNIYQVKEMDVIQFTRMLSDKDFPNLKKLKYKYPGDFAVFVETLKTLYYKELPIKATDGTPLVYMDNYVNVDLRSVKLLLRQQRESYGVKAVEDEILASSAIESIDFDRDSVRSILRGFAPKDEAENRILGQKKGVEFISNPGNNITEENLHALYQMMVGDFLPAEERLPDGAYYRNDAVYVVSDHVEHSGTDHRLLPEYMRALIVFIQAEDGINELLKAAMIHFYIAYLHPYFDGNGRMARMVHLWYLIQRGYQTTLFVPFSSLIAKSRREYYSAFTVVEENSKLSGVLDVTPFLQYFTKMVYDRMQQSAVSTDILTQYREATEAGQVTEKESALWRFVLSHYGSNEFSTKQLERDFGNAAYATIRSFVLKFQAIGLLESAAYGKRVKYRIKP